MKKITKLTECGYWELIGLLTLAKTLRKQLEYIERSIGDLLAIDKPSDSHICDFIWGVHEGSATKQADDLLEYEEIQKP